VNEETYCCAMRGYYILGIVGVRKGATPPIDTVDFINDFHRPTVIHIAYCPFCGKKMDRDQTRRVIQ